MRAAKHAQLASARRRRTPAWRGDTTHDAKRSVELPVPARIRMRLPGLPGLESSGVACSGEVSGAFAVVVLPVGDMPTR
jgi:hypothetical protein